MDWGDMNVKVVVVVVRRTVVAIFMVEDGGLNWT